MVVFIVNTYTTIDRWLTMVYYVIKIEQLFEKTKTLILGYEIFDLKNMRSPPLVEAKGDHRMICKI